MQGPYSDHILDANDVCGNCLRLVRRERVSKIRKGDRTRGSGAWTSNYERVRRRTSVDYCDAGDDPTQAKGVWCDCGVEDAHHRIWHPEDIDKARFKDLLLNALQTLDEKGVTLRKKETAAYALQAFLGGDGVDAALAEAIDAGIVAAAASEASDDRPVRADGGDSVET